MVDHLAVPLDFGRFGRLPVTEVGEGRGAGVAGLMAEVPEGSIRLHAAPELAEGRPSEGDRRRFLKLADGPTGTVLGDAVDVGIGRDALGLHEGVVDRDQVEAGVHDEDRAAGRDLVEVPGDESLTWEVDGVEPPGEERLGRAGVAGHHRFRLTEPIDDVLEGPAGGPYPPVGATPVEVAAVGVEPHAAGHCVAVRLDEPG